MQKKDHFLKIVEWSDELNVGHPPIDTLTNHPSMCTLRCTQKEAQQ